MGPYEGFALEAPPDQVWAMNQPMIVISEGVGLAYEYSMIIHNSQVWVWYIGCQQKLALVLDIQRPHTYTLMHIILYTSVIIILYNI